MLQRETKVLNVQMESINKKMPVLWEHLNNFEKANYNLMYTLHSIKKKIDKITTPSPQPEYEGKSTSDIPSSFESKLKQNIYNLNSLICLATEIDLTLCKLIGDSDDKCKQVKRS